MASRRKNSSRVPWLADDRPEIDKMVAALVAETDKAYERQDMGPKLKPKQRQELRAALKKAEQSRGPAMAVMTHLAGELGIVDLHNDVIMAPMKDLGRASAKFLAADRNMDDLGRGRLLISDAKQVRAFEKALRQKGRDDQPAFVKAHKVKMGECTENYLRNPRSHGYAGSINFCLEVKLPKSQRVGRIEVQIMPIQYLDTDKRSHRLYDMLRILKEIPESIRSVEQQEILDALIHANTALWDEDAIRYEYMSLRKDKKPFMPSDEELAKDLDILDRLRDAIEHYPNEMQEWREEAMDAITYAKTSLEKLNRSRRNLKPVHQPEPAA